MVDDVDGFCLLVFVFLDVLVFEIDLDRSVIGGCYVVFFFVVVLVDYSVDDLFCDGGSV